MPNVRVSVELTESGRGYDIVIDPYRAQITKDDQEIVWDSNCQIAIELDHPGHFPRFAAHAYGILQQSGLMAAPTVAPNGTYHYKVNILVPDTDAEREGRYKNIICIDPDYKVDR